MQALSEPVNKLLEPLVTKANTIQQNVEALQAELNSAYTTIAELRPKPSGKKSNTPAKSSSNGYGYGSTGGGVTQLGAAIPVSGMVPRATAQVTTQATTQLRGTMPSPAVSSSTISQYLNDIKLFSSNQAFMNATANGINMLINPLSSQLDTINKIVGPREDSDNVPSDGGGRTRRRKLKRNKSRMKKRI